MFPGTISDLDHNFIASGFLVARCFLVSIPRAAGRAETKRHIMWFIPLPWDRADRGEMFSEPDD
jgi:hypothetical protein